jgi:N utilization substance protein B
MLQDFNQNQKKIWDLNDSFIRTTLDDIEESDIYKEYMESPENSYEEDREIWRKIYKNILSYNDELDAFLEEQSLYWNDDKEIVDTFVLKSIKRFEEKNGSKQELLKEYKDEEDKEFARRLLRKAILNCDYYMHLIGDQARNWDLNSLAFMDVIIMQIALAEMLTFPNIPIQVTINEYVDIAKLYSTPKSGGYVNAILDNIAKKLQAEGKLFK